MNHNRNMFLGFSILFLGMIITSSFPISFNETIQTQAYAILDSPIIHMSDTSVGSGRSTASDRPLHAEFVSPTSQLVGDAIDSITMKLKKTNSPTGIAQIGVFNADLTVKKLFGTIDSATMSPSYTDLTFSLPLGQTYQIQSGDLIGIKFTGGDSVNRISTMIDDNSADPFDGTNSYHTYYTTTWNPFPTNDLYMILRQSSTGTFDTTAPVTTATPPGGFYSTLQSVTLTANEAATIYYTTNGSIPTVSSTVYTTAIPISATATLKFFAKDTAGNLEAVKTQTYTINTTTSITINDVSLTEGNSGTKNFVFTVARSTNTSTMSINYFTTDNTAVIPVDYTAKPTAAITFTAGGPLTQIVSVPVVGDIAVEPNETFSVNLSNCVGCAIADNQGVGTIINDDLPPVTTATPPGGFYSTLQSVTLTANEAATIYYTTNGSIPTVSSTVYTTAIPISATATLKFFAKDTAGNLEAVKTQTYTINTSSTSDVFGIKQIYPTKTGGNTWFMNMVNPSSDPRFDSQSTITKNADGSWKMKSSQVRMNVFSTDKTTYGKTTIPTLSRTQLASNGYMQLPSDWKNFEMTGYVKLNAGSNDDFTWYGRGGSHNDANGGCQGSSYKAELSFNGGTRFAKESWHVHYDFTGKKSSTPSIVDKWAGFKFVLYNKPGVKFAQQVQGEIWVDLQNNNNWVKVDSFVDDGWGSGASHCGPATADNMPITWGGPMVDFRTDNAPDFDFKYLSVREINSP